MAPRRLQRRSSRPHHPLLRSSRSATRSRAAFQRLSNSRAASRFIGSTASWLDPGVVAELLLTVPDPAMPDGSSFATAPADATALEPFGRLLRLLSAPADSRVLAGPFVRGFATACCRVRWATRFARSDGVARALPRSGRPQTRLVPTRISRSALKRWPPIASPGSGFRQEPAAWSRPVLGGWLGLNVSSGAVPDLDVRPGRQNGSLGGVLRRAAIFSRGGPDGL